MNEELSQLKKEIQELQDWKKSLEKSSSIPLSVNQAFKERFFGSRFLFGQATLDFGSIAANGNESKTIPVTGASPGDAVIVGLPTASSLVDGNRIFVAYVSAPNVVSLYLTNKTAGAIDPASGLFTVCVIKKT